MHLTTTVQINNKGTATSNFLPTTHTAQGITFLPTTNAHVSSPIPTSQDIQIACILTMSLSRNQANWSTENKRIFLTRSLLFVTSALWSISSCTNQDSVCWNLPNKVYHSDKVLKLIRRHTNTMQQVPCSYQQTGMEIKLFIDSKRNVLGTQNCFF